MATHFDREAPDRSGNCRFDSDRAYMTARKDGRFGGALSESLGQLWKGRQSIEYPRCSVRIRRPDLPVTWYTQPVWAGE
mgnify:CR=1 FL=1